MRIPLTNAVTAFFATVYVVATVIVCLLGADWALVGLFELKETAGMALYAVTLVAGAAFAVWFARAAWAGECELAATEHGRMDDEQVLMVPRVSPGS